MDLYNRYKNKINIYFKKKFLFKYYFFTSFILTSYKRLLIIEYIIIYIYIYIYNNIILYIYIYIIYYLL